MLYRFTHIDYRIGQTTKLRERWRRSATSAGSSIDEAGVGNNVTTTNWMATLTVIAQN